MDTHFKPSNFGVIPTIFGIPSYTFFVGLGLIVGIVYYFLSTRKLKSRKESTVEIVSAGLISGIIGAKIPLLIGYIAGSTNIQTVIYGKSILGGLIGGMLGVKLIKKILRIKTRIGNIIAPSIALGMSIGRFGCFFNGCCYGKPNSWGVDFGDGILRYPTQLFEVAFHFIAFLILRKIQYKFENPGILFKYYLLAYFICRFFCEFIRDNHVYYFGLTIYQLICLMGIVFIGINAIIINRKRGIKSE